MSSQHFTATILKAGTRVYIQIPFDPNDVWGTKQRHHVTGSINGCTIRGPLDTNGEHYILPLGPAWRRDNQIDAGSTVEVILAAEGPQATLLAPDIAAAFAGESQARAFFDSLPTFYRNNYIRWIESAKRPETRQNRIKEMLQLLKEEKRQR